MKIINNAKGEITTGTFIIGIIITAFVVFGLTLYYFSLNNNRQSPQRYSNVNGMSTGNTDPMHSGNSDSMASHHGNTAVDPSKIVPVDSMLGKQAPDFSLEDLDGNTVKLSDYRGKKVVLFFNEGNMCYPACWNQIGSLKDDSRFNNNDIVSFSIVVDSKSQWQNIISRVPKLAGSKILFDTSKSVSSSYNTLYLESSMHKGTFPGHTYFIIDKDGIIKYALDDPSMAIRNDLLASEVSKIA